MHLLAFDLKSRKLRMDDEPIKAGIADEDITPPAKYKNLNRLLLRKRKSFFQFLKIAHLNKKLRRPADPECGEVLEENIVTYHRRLFQASRRILACRKISPSNSFEISPT